MRRCYLTPIDDQLNKVFQMDGQVQEHGGVDVLIGKNVIHMDMYRHKHTM